VGSGNSPQKHVWRARIVLLSAEGVGTMEIQRRTGKGKPTIWRWQARFMAEGVDGLLHEATRPAGKPPLTPEMIERVVEITLAEPPGETTHWTCRADGEGGRAESFANIVPCRRRISSWFSSSYVLLRCLGICVHWVVGLHGFLSSRAGGLGRGNRYALHESRTASLSS